MRLEFTVVTGFVPHKSGYMLVWWDITNINGERVTDPDEWVGMQKKLGDDGVPQAAIDAMIRAAISCRNYFNRRMASIPYEQALSPI